MEIKEIVPNNLGVVLIIILVFSITTIVLVLNVIGSWSITVMAILTGVIISMAQFVQYFTDTIES